MIAAGKKQVLDDVIIQIDNNETTGELAKQTFDYLQRHEIKVSQFFFLGRYKRIQTRCCRS